MRLDESDGHRRLAARAGLAAAGTCLVGQAQLGRTPLLQPVQVEQQRVRLSGQQQSIDAGASILHLCRQRAQPALEPVRHARRLIRLLRLPRHDVKVSWQLAPNGSHQMAEPRGAAHAEGLGVDRRKGRWRERDEAERDSSELEPAPASREESLHGEGVGDAFDACVGHLTMGASGFPVEAAMRALDRLRQQGRGEEGAAHVEEELVGRREPAPGRVHHHAGPERRRGRPESAEHFPSSGGREDIAGGGPVWLDPLLGVGVGQAPRPAHALQASACNRDRVDRLIAPARLPAETLQQRDQERRLRHDRRLEHVPAGREPVKQHMDSVRGRSQQQP
mmetsp:Transcript_32839/g.106162  ORF Transcript_32839/g.106162 Transcript_32839/m.106162 type:complete len:335 (+) Transcript_32839:598-1602(+)